MHRFGLRGRTPAQTVAIVCRQGRRARGKSTCYACIGRGSRTIPRGRQHSRFYVTARGVGRPGGGRGQARWGAPARAQLALEFGIRSRGYNFVFPTHRRARKFPRLGPQPGEKPSARSAAEEPVAPPKVGWRQGRHDGTKLTAYPGAACRGRAAAGRVAIAARAGRFGAARSCCSTMSQVTQLTPKPAITHHPNPTHPPPPAPRCSIWRADRRGLAGRRTPSRSGGGMTMIHGPRNEMVRTAGADIGSCHGTRARYWETRGPDPELFAQPKAGRVSAVHPQQ